MANEIDVEETFKLCRTILALGPVRDRLRDENIRLEGLNKQLAADHAAKQAEWGNLELQRAKLFDEVEAQARKKREQDIEIAANDQTIAAQTSQIKANAARLRAFNEGHGLMTEAAEA